jgi:peptide/nickel transport system substrate-binding protein
MKRGIILVPLTFLLVTSLLLASCNKSTTTSTTTTTTSQITTPTTTTTTNQITTPTTTTTTVVSTTATTTSTGNWWDKLGTPTYGGTLVDRMQQNITTFDPYTSTNGQSGYAPYLSQLWQGNYATDPSIWDFQIGWLPDQYATGLMMTGYTMPNLYTVVCNLRTDMYWQNIAPSFGRQFTSADVVAHYDRLLGLGMGYTIDPYYISVTAWAPLLSVVATDKYTVTFNWKQGAAGVTSILTVMEAAGADNSFDDIDAVTAYTTASQPQLLNWHNAIGTGPFILTDFVDSSSATYTANPNFFGHDLRFTQNQLPYIQTLKILIIPNAPTGEAAMRVGKLDGYGSMPTQDALNMMKTNPEIVVKQKPQGNEYTLDPNNAVAPWNSVALRTALQHAIDIKTITATYYQGYGTPWPASLTENQMGLGGWGFAYPDWPADVQATYTFDTTLAKQMLAAAGFPNGMNTNCVLESDADQGLYQIVQSELASVGVNMSITSLQPAQWQSTIMTSHAYDALCARNQGLMGFNFDIFRMFMRYTTGYQSNYIQVNDPVMNKFYADAQAAPTVAGVQKLLHDCNLYVAQQHFVISLAQPSTFNMVQPWIMGAVGANTLGDAVTGAGFGDGVPIAVWVNQSLKTSLGH